MLGAILKQLLERDGIPESVRKVFREEKRGLGGRAVQLLDLLKILKMTIASLPKVFICIDGLDECLPKNRRELLESLQDIVRALPNTRVFLSGRPHIRDEVKRCFTEAIMIPITPTIEDIWRYLRMKLDRDPVPYAMDDNLRTEIMRVILEKISPMWVKTTLAKPLLVGYLLTKYRFLLVSLNIEAVLEEVTISQRKKKLDEMIQGNGLREAYSATLARIKAQKGSKSRAGMEVLMWLSHSGRSLNTNELCHALGVEIGSTELDPRNIPAIETLLGCSLGLVVVEESSHTVRLVHYTLQEYLSNNTDLFHRPHSMIAQVCLTYLNFQSIRNLPPILEHPPVETPLLEYASCYWGTHARRESTESVNTLALRLLGGFDKHISSGILLSHACDKWDKELGRSNPMGFTGLHCAAYFGIAETAVALLEMKKWDLNATDVAGNTAILWAVRKGHGATVKALLDLEDATPNTADRTGRTLLSWAAGCGHGEIVEMLLERMDVAPNIPDNDGQTPLLWAVTNMHEDVVKLFLEWEDVTPNTADKIGRTPLLWAARTGNGGIVKMLLEREDIDTNTADKGGLTPILWAATNEHAHIMKLFLEREDVTPSTTDNNGRNPDTFEWWNPPITVQREPRHRMEDLTDQTHSSTAAARGSSKAATRKSGFSSSVSGSQ